MFYKKMPKCIAGLMIFIFLFIVGGCADTTVNKPGVQPTNEINKVDIPVIGQLKIHYIDVGQGDSILIQQGSSNMLIDTGTNASTSSLIAYLKSQNINKINYLVLTHPHEDHIGGADAVIKEFDIGTVYMPKVKIGRASCRERVS